MNEKDAKFWGQRAAGVRPGSQGFDLFQQKAARLLSTLPYSLVFQSSRVNDGKIESGKVQLDDDGNATFSGTDTNAGVHVLVENDKISNLYNADGTVNSAVLSVCLQKLEGVSVVVQNLSAKDNTSLSDKFTATTGRDRLLDFMRTKTNDARGKETYRPPREVIVAIHAEVNEMMARDRAAQIAQMRAAGMVVDDQPGAAPQ